MGPWSGYGARFPICNGSHSSGFQNHPSKRVAVSRAEILILKGKLTLNLGCPIFRGFRKVGTMLEEQISPRGFEKAVIVAGSHISKIARCGAPQNRITTKLDRRVPPVRCAIKQALHGLQCSPP